MAPQPALRNETLNDFRQALRDVQSQSNAGVGRDAPQCSNSAIIDTFDWRRVKKACGTLFGFGAVKGCRSEWKLFGKLAGSEIEILKGASLRPLSILDARLLFDLRHIGSAAESARGPYQSKISGSRKTAPASKII